MRRTLRLLPLPLFLLLLATPPARAGDEVRDAIDTFEENFAPGMTAGTRESALRKLEAVRDEDVLGAFEWAYDQTAHRIRRLLVEKDDAGEEVKRLEAEIDAAMMRANERAKKDGKPPPTSITLPGSLIEGQKAARRKVESLQRDIDTEYELRRLAAESAGRWIAGLEGEDRADVLKDVERGGARDGDWACRVFWVRALAAAPVAEASRLLMVRLEDERDNRVLPVLIDGLADQAGASAVGVLLPWLSDERWQIRATTIAALGRIRSPEAIEPLVARLRQEDGRLRGDVADALKRITGQDLGLDPDRWQRWWEENRGKFEPPKADPDAPDGAPPPARPAKEGDSVAFYGIRIVSKRILFVIDISGSMNQPATGGGNRTKLEVAKNELERAILGLPEGAAFNIIFYHHEVSVWRRGMIEADGRDRRRAVEFVQGIEGDGNTNIHDALERAFHLVGMGATDKEYEVGADTIFFLSDGLPNRGKIVDPNGILAEVKRWNSLRRVKIHTVGVGPDHDAAFMRALAASSGGEYVSR